MMASTLLTDFIIQRLLIAYGTFAIGHAAERLLVNYYYGDKSTTVIRSRRLFIVYYILDCMLAL